MATARARTTRASRARLSAPLVRTRRAPTQCALARTRRQVSEASWGWEMKSRDLASAACAPRVRSGRNSNGGRKRPESRDVTGNWSARGRRSSGRVRAQARRARRTIGIGASSVASAYAARVGEHDPTARATYAPVHRGRVPPKVLQDCAHEANKRDYGGHRWRGRACPPRHPAGCSFQMHGVRPPRDARGAPRTAYRLFRVICVSSRCSYRLTGSAWEVESWRHGPGKTSVRAS